MRDQLFPYQEAGAKWLSGKKIALLADEMGLGKTAQAVRACDRVSATKILVVCPAVARVNWEREFKRWSSRPQHPARVEKAKDVSIKNVNSLICSFEGAVKCLNQLIQLSPWDVVIVDESHFLKSAEAVRAKAILGKGGLIHHTRRLWALSGTPAPNHLGDLWPYLYTSKSTPLKYDQFIERYCHARFTVYGWKIAGAKREKIPEIKAMLAQTMLRRRKEEVLVDLPPIFYQSVTVEAGIVDPDQESSFIQYVFPRDRRTELKAALDKQEKLVKDIVDQTKEGVTRLRALEALAPSVSTLRRYTGLQKVAAIAEIVGSDLDIGAYDKVVIFAIHRDVIEKFRVLLARHKPVTLYGGTPPGKRQENIDKFQKRVKCRVFIGNILAAGPSITLTAAHQVVFAEQDWVPANNAQAAMRCHRIGQTKTVVVRFFGLANSIDERVTESLKRKTKDLTLIFDDSPL